MRGIEGTAGADEWRIPRPGWFFLWGADAIAVLLVLALIAAVTLGFTAARTVYYLDAAEVCVVALLPAEATLLLMTVPSDWWAGRLDGLFDKGAGAAVNAMAGVFILAVLLPVNAAMCVCGACGPRDGIGRLLERVQKSEVVRLIGKGVAVGRPRRAGSPFQSANQLTGRSTPSPAARQAQPAS